MFGKKYVWLVKLEACRYNFNGVGDTTRRLSEIVGIFAKKSDACNWIRNYGSRYVSNMMEWFSLGKLNKWHVSIAGYGYKNVELIECVSDTSEKFSTDFGEYTVYCTMWLLRKELRQNAKSLGTFYEERDPE